MVTLLRPGRFGIPIDALTSAFFLQMSDPIPSEERFRLLVEAVVDYGIFMLDPDGRIVSWNAGAERLKQYRRDEVIGRHFSLFYPPEAISAGWPDEELRRAKELGRFEDEGWRLRKDGTMFWANVVITALVGEDGQLDGYAKVTRDLTERRRHEEVLRESEQRFRLLIESVTDYAIFMLDKSGRIASWNPGAEKIKGYSSAEVIGRHFSIFYTSEDIKVDKPTYELETSLAVGRVEDEGWRVRKDGTAFWANVVITPVYDADHVLHGFAKVTRDMTQHRRLEELQNSSQRMTQFLAMLAHELRNPLAPMRNAVALMQLEPMTSPVVRNSRDIIDRQLTQVTRLVDDLLDAGRMTSGKIRLKKERILYNQVIANAIETVRALADARRHNLVLDLPTVEVYLNVDGVRLAQVLQNLLLNAIKFTPDGGRISLSVRLEHNHVYTTVDDNGVGLSKAAKDEIFELFSQGDGEAAARESGLGIGLTLAKALVEMHGGVLSVLSDGPGMGSRFMFFLPDPQILESIDDTADPRSSLRCLVVDDNRDAADTLAQLVRMMGCTVKTAYSGPSGLELAGGFSPEVVLLDLGMPGMDGFEVCRRLRKETHGKEMFIAAVTGYNSDQDIVRTSAAGFDDHFAKPLELATLLKMIAMAGKKFGKVTAA